MINVVYLVLVFYAEPNRSYHAAASVAIPQANMAQCQVNAKSYSKDNDVKKSYCIVGVK